MHAKRKYIRQLIRWLFLACRSPIKKIFSKRHIKEFGGVCGEKKTRPWHVRFNYDRTILSTNLQVRTYFLVRVQHQIIEFHEN